MPTLSKADIDALLDKWLEELFTSTRNDFSNRDPLVEEYSDTTFEDDILETQAYDYRLALSQNETSMVSKSAHNFCKKYRLSLRNVCTVYDCGGKPGAVHSALNWVTPNEFANSCSGLIHNRMDKVA